MLQRIEVVEAVRAEKLGGAVVRQHKLAEKDQLPIAVALAHRFGDFFTGEIFHKSKKQHKDTEDTEIQL